MLIQTFEILLDKLNSKVKYRLSVEVVFKTNKIIKFKIVAGEKEIIMQKHLYRKNNSWDILTTNFRPNTDNSKLVEQTYVDIQKKIEEYLFD